MLCTARGITDDSDLHFVFLEALYCGNSGEQFLKEDFVHGHYVAMRPNEHAVLAETSSRKFSYVHIKLCISFYLVMGYGINYAVYSTSRLHIRN